MGLTKKIQAQLAKRLYKRLHKLANRIHPTNSSGNNTSKM